MIGMEKNIRLDKWRRLSAIDDTSKTVFSVRKLPEKKKKQPEAKRRSHQHPRRTREDQMVSLGQRLHSVRCSRIPPITQTNLAAILNTTVRTIKRWESDQSNPRRRLPDIAAALGVAEVDLLDFDGPIPPPRNHRAAQ
jgi:DNA-binding transcriptional regulator YiaG